MEVCVDDEEEALVTLLSHSYEVRAVISDAAETNHYNKFTNVLT